MIISSWNVNSIRARILNVQEYLKKFINQNQKSPSIIMVLGEIQNPVEFMNELFCSEYLSSISKS